MRLSKILISIILFLFLLAPALVLADGGMVVWPPEVYLDQSAQNAIVAWNGQEEIIILSNDIESDEAVTVLRIVPLPSNPTKIEEGSFDSFEKLVEIMNTKIEELRSEFLGLGKEAEVPAAGIEITFQKQIGAHDVTVVKVNDLDYFLDWVEGFVQDKGLGEKEISSEFKTGVANYLKRGIKHFVFDVIEAAEEKESIKPLIYQFNSDFLYYPLKITATSDIGGSLARIHIFFITEKGVPDTLFTFQNLGGWFNISYSVELTQEELEEVSSQITDLFEDKVTVKKVSFFGNLSDLRKDVILYSPQLWEKDLKSGSSGEEVKALQEILINEEVWDSEVEVTGYFGPITKRALAKFQEKYSSEILEPIELKSGTGYFGEMTKNYLQKVSLEIKEIEKEVKWNRNLTVGMTGEDVKSLQEILIKEGVWGVPEVEATGFFGPITKEAIIKFQERYSTEILQPLELEEGTGFVGPSTLAFLNEYTIEVEDFCGWSTYGECNSDEDCSKGGCSGQVCESRFDESIITTCEWRDCYNAERYSLGCKCINSKCQWSK